VDSTGVRFEANTTRSSNLPADLLTEVAERLGTESATALANINEGNRDDLPAVVNKIAEAQVERFLSIGGSGERNRILGTLAKVIGQLPPEHRAGLLAGIASWLPQSAPGATPMHAVLEASKELSAQQRQKVFDTTLEKVQYDASSLHLLSKAVWAHPHERPSDEILKIIRSFDSVQVDGYATANLRDIISEVPASKIGSDERMALVTELVRQGKRIDPTDWIGKAWQMVCDANEPELLQKSFNPLLSLIQGRVLHFGEAIASKSPLKSMAARLCELPETELRPAWSQMKEIVRSRPELIKGSSPAQARGAAGAMEGVLAGLMETVPRLAPEMQGEAAALIKGHWPASSKAIAKLASAIPDLTEEARQKAFDVVVSCMEEAEAHLNLSASQPKSISLSLRANLLANPQASQAALAEVGGMAGLLLPLPRAAGALPGLAARAAVDQVLKRLQEYIDPSSRAEVLKSLARDALPAVLERPVALGIPTKRHVSREAILQTFARKLEELPLDHRIPALRQMIQDSEAHASSSTSLLSRNKSGKLPALLRKLLQSAIS